MNNLKVIKTDLPFPPYSISSYLIKTRRNRILFDTSIKDKKNIGKIISEVEKFGGIDLIILSHGHLDHSGCAGIISKELDIPVYVSFNERERISSGIEERMDRRIVKIMKVLDFFGFDKESSQKEREKLSFYKKFMDPIDVFFNINTINDNDIEIIDVPGHTEGSVALYIKDSAVLLSGDALLSEGISAFFDVERLTDTLSEYLLSLEKIEKLKPATVYPAHMEGFHNVSEVIESHKKYVLKKSKKIIELSDKGENIKEIKSSLYPENYNILIVLAEIIYSLEKKGVPVLRELKNLLS